MDKLKILAPLINNRHAEDYFASHVVSRTPLGPEVCRFLCEQGVPTQGALHHAGTWSLTRAHLVHDG